MSAIENSPSAQPSDLVSTEGLGLLVNRALFADECQRLAEWALIGPVQRAALESFAERLLAAERERWQVMLLAAVAEAKLNVRLHQSFVTKVDERGWWMESKA